jgi:hypothetical protein
MPVNRGNAPSRHLDAGDRIGCVAFIDTSVSGAEDENPLI